MDLTYIMLPLDRMVDRELKEVAREYTLEPEDKGNGRIGIFLIHGIASTPQVFRNYAEMIQEKGYHVCVCRIEGHGTSPAHLAVTTAEEWYQSVAKQLEEFNDNYNLEKTIIIGHSLGSLLALLLVSQYQHKFNVQSAMFLSTPINPKNPVMYLFYRLIPLMSHVVKYIPVPPAKLEIIRKERHAIVYHKHPLALFSEVRRLRVQVLSRLYRISCPILLGIGTEDEFVHHSSHDIIRAGIASEEVEEFLVPDASHALVDTSDMELLERTLLGFIDKYASLR